MSPRKLWYKSSLNIAYTKKLVLGDPQTGSESVAVGNDVFLYGIDSEEGTDFFFWFIGKVTSIPVDNGKK
jgi:hypothetical protein